MNQSKIIQKLQNKIKQLEKQNHNLKQKMKNLKVSNTQKLKKIRKKFSKKNFSKKTGAKLIPRHSQDKILRKKLESGEKIVTFSAHVRADVDEAYPTGVENEDGTRWVTMKDLTIQLLEW